MRAARSALKTVVGTLALSPLLVSRTRRSLAGRVNVVYIHYVGENTPYYADFYAGSTLERFDSDLARLGEHFAFAPLADVLRHEHEDRRSPPLLALTFDDGFDMLRNGVMDVLDAHGVKATMFVITSTLGNANLMWRNKLSAIRTLREERRYVARYNDLAAKLALREITSGRQLMQATAEWPMDRKEELVDTLWASCDMPPLDEFLQHHRPYFSWDGLTKWVERGHAVGLHTATHPYCSRLSEHAVHSEIVEPAAFLREKLRMDFLPLSYPFGSRLPPTVERELHDRGVFDCAFGIEGFAPREADAVRLERAYIEEEIGFSVFGKAFLGLPSV